MSNAATSVRQNSAPRRLALGAALLLAAAIAPLSEAAAVSQSVKFACVSDYLNYCSQHPVDSKALRQCMRAAGPRLSKRCVDALVAAGEVSKSEVNRRAASAAR